MIFNPTNVKVYISRDPTSFHKSYDGLALLVSDVLQMNPLSGHIFVFFNRNRDQVKALYWDRNGFCIWQKRLVKGKFANLPLLASHWEISFQELQTLFGGFELTPIQIHEHKLKEKYEMGIHEEKEPPQVDFKECRVN